MKVSFDIEHEQDRNVEHFLKHMSNVKVFEEPGHCLFTVYITRLAYSKKNIKKTVQLKFSPVFDEQMMIGSCKLQTIVT